MKRGRSTLILILGFIALIIIGSLPASAGRLLTTPFAEVPKEGSLRVQESVLRQSKSNDDLRVQHRLDIGLTDRAELGVVVVSPEGKPSKTQFNLQYQLAPEKSSGPAISVGVWDAGHIGKFSGQTSGGSFFVVVSKSVDQGGVRKPIKLSLGVGTNKLEGIFGGLNVPLNGRLGLMADYSPEHSRLTNAGAINVGVYYFPNSTSRVRLSSIGGNPQFDMYLTTSWH